MREQDILKKHGEHLCWLFKREIHKEKLGTKSLVSIVVWIAIVVMLVYTLMSDSKAHAMDCSWYSEGALKRDGQWDITKGVMANGEQFADSLMVGANGYAFPLNSVVRITNPANGRHIEVVIKDRINSRFGQSRLDLSPRAFSELAGLEQGIIKNVTVEVL